MSKYRKMVSPWGVIYLPNSPYNHHWDGDENNKSLLEKIWEAILRKFRRK